MDAPDFAVGSDFAVELDLAEPVCSDQPGSFPWSVLHDRHPALLAQVRAAYPYPAEIMRALDQLEQEIEGPITLVTDDAPDASQWRSWAGPYLGRSWYEVPFLWAENYFYRKLLAAVGYLEPGPWQGVDPFGPVKAAELAGATVTAELAALETLAEIDPEQRAQALLLAALWGNQADLGFLAGSGAGVGFGAAAPAAGHRDQLKHLVTDDREVLSRLLAADVSGQPVRVLLVADNAGRELLPDLVLIDDLLATGRAAEVVLQVKPSPYFVSDATTGDVLAALNRLAAGPPVAAVIADRLRAALRAGRLRLRTHPFFVAPFGYQDLPTDLRAEFVAATVTILKGDLNYRRLVGDRVRPVTSSFGELTRYFPSPVVALRTLKSDVVVGLRPEIEAELDASGKAWRTSGTYALIQARA